MAHDDHISRLSSPRIDNPAAQPNSPEDGDLTSPFGTINALDCNDYAEAAYEVFFTACRSSPGFGGSRPGGDDGGDAAASPAKPSAGVGMATTSRVKRALGLKMLRRSPVIHRRTNSYGASSGFSSPRTRQRRPMTAAEIMRHQMRVTEESDSRLRKTLMHTHVAQMGRCAETIILPLELLRHLKPSEFSDAKEYHQWQMRQLKILKVGLLQHPSVPLDKLDPAAIKLNKIIEDSKSRAIDTSKNSETMRALSNCVISLARRAHEDDGMATDVCHWADGYPLNVEIYTSLLHAIFDVRDGTSILDEVDELLELMKKTWSMLGINRRIHNLCFTWKLFEQYVVTGQVEPDLLSATLTMLVEVANDAKKASSEDVYATMLAHVLSEIKKWCEKRLGDYHGYYTRATIGLMENIIPLVLSVTKILLNDVPCSVASPQQSFDDKSCIDQYIRSSAKNIFAKMVDLHNASTSEKLSRLVTETVEVASIEKYVFSPVLKKWHRMPAEVFIITLHSCYGALLKQYLTGISDLTMETFSALQRAGKLEKMLMQIVSELSVGRKDGGQLILSKMASYDIDTVIVNLQKEWIEERLKMGKEILQNATETESWNPKSKSEPYAQSAVELIRFAKESIESFFVAPMNASKSSINDLSDGLEHLLENYIAFICSCGSKYSYLPTLPPLTRCSRDSKFLKLWKRAACGEGMEPTSLKIFTDQASHHRPSASRGTQRLYIRLNTLHYILSHLHSIEKALSLSPKLSPQRNRSRAQSIKHMGAPFFEKTRASIERGSWHVSEVAAYRLIFLDLNNVFYGSLYVVDIAATRIQPLLGILKQNITLLTAMVVERVQQLALKELMKASFEAYVTVLLAGGSSRVFSRLDHPMIEDDFNSLKRLFSEGLIPEEEVERASETAEGVVALMGQMTEQLVEEFSILSSEADDIMSVVPTGQKLPLPPTTRQWNRTDPNTILRVLCHRNDRIAVQFLKRTFHLAKRVSP